MREWSWTPCQTASETSTSGFTISYLSKLLYHTGGGVWIQGISFSSLVVFIKALQLSLPYYLLIACDGAGGKYGFMPFLIALVYSEMQLALSRIWTWLAESICSDDSLYLNKISISNTILKNILIEEIFRSFCAIRMKHRA